MIPDPLVRAIYYVALKKRLPNQDWEAIGIINRILEQILSMRQRDNKYAAAFKSRKFHTQKELLRILFKELYKKRFG